MAPSSVRMRSVPFRAALDLDIVTSIVFVFVSGMSHDFALPKLRFKVVVNHRACELLCQVTSRLSCLQWKRVCGFASSRWARVWKMKGLFMYDSALFVEELLLVYPGGAHQRTFLVLNHE